MKIIKKTIILILIGGNMFLYAGQDNYVNLSDIKDALYYLIKDYKRLYNQSLNNNKDLNKINLQLQQEIDAIKNQIKNRNIRVDEELKQLMKEIENLKKRAILIKNSKGDYLDKYISNFVDKNKPILLKIKAEQE